MGRWQRKRKNDGHIGTAKRDKRIDR